MFDKHENSKFSKFHFRTSLKYILFNFQFLTFLCNYYVIITQNTKMNKTSTNLKANKKINTFFINFNTKIILKIILKQLFNFINWLSETLIQSIHILKDIFIQLLPSPFPKPSKASSLKPCQYNSQDVEII